MEEPKSPNKAIIATIVVVLLVIATTVVVVTTNKPATDTASDTPAISSLSGSSRTPSNPNAVFKDGTYTASGSYNSPGGLESIDVKVTLANSGKINDISVVPHANVQEAADYQSQFVSGYKSQVLGKKINEVNLSRVAGSSLTSIGFNSAIDDIEKQAQA